MKRLTVLALAGAAWGLCAQAQDTGPLRITKQTREFVVQTPDGPLVVTRAKRAGGLTKGFIQPLVPQPGVTPVTEIDVLHALNDPSTMVIDMRDDEEPLGPTIPNSYHIPYTELEDRLDELGCQPRGKSQWDCTNAFKIVAFCHGPMCVQSPAGIARIVHMGFPVNKISYYRGGMMDWEALGLTTVKGYRPSTR